MNWFFVKCRGEIDVTSVDCGEYIRNDGKGMYMLLEERNNDVCVHQRNNDVV